MKNDKRTQTTILNKLGNLLVAKAGATSFEIEPFELSGGYRLGKVIVSYPGNIKIAYIGNLNEQFCAEVEVLSY